jgi:hypothetical protein
MFCQTNILHKFYISNTLYTMYTESDYSNFIIYYSYYVWQPLVKMLQWLAYTFVSNELSIIVVIDAKR